MTTATRLIAEASVTLGIVPLLFVAMRDRAGFRIERHWWVMAAAFGISFIADSAAHWVSPWIIGVVYPLSQASLFGAVVMLDVRKKWGFLALLLGVGIFAVLTHGVSGPDILLRTVACLGLSLLVWPLRSLGVLRWSLLAYFLVGWGYWMAYVLLPGWTTYLLYQSSRVLGISLFCYAASRPVRSHLRLIVLSRAA